MTSASRDLFDHFYKAIKITFLEQFNDKEINSKVKQNLNLRKWSSECSIIIGNAKENKNLDSILPILNIKDELELPKEYEYKGDKIIPEEERIFDQNIDTTFNEFYNKANLFLGWEILTMVYIIQNLNFKRKMGRLLQLYHT